MSKQDEKNEPFAKAEKILDELEEEMKSKQMRDESLIVIGQSMANLLYWFTCNVIDEQFDDKRKKAIELIARWEKEFIQFK